MLSSWGIEFARARQRLLECADFETQQRIGHQLKEGEVAQRDLADQLLGQVVAADEDVVGRAAAEARFELPSHRWTVSFVL